MRRHGVVFLTPAASERLKLVDVEAGAVRKGGVECEEEALPMQRASLNWRR